MSVRNVPAVDRFRYERMPTEELRSAFLLDDLFARGEVRLQDIPARIASPLAAYREWIAASRLSSGTMTVELLLAFDESFVHAVSAVEVPADQARTLRLGRRGLALGPEDRAGSGQELAYISHAKKTMSDLWPG